MKKASAQNDDRPHPRSVPKFINGSPAAASVFPCAEGRRVLKIHLIFVKHPYRGGAARRYNRICISRRGCGGGGKESCHSAAAAAWF